MCSLLSPLFLFSSIVHCSVSSFIHCSVSSCIHCSVSSSLHDWCFLALFIVLLLHVFIVPLVPVSIRVVANARVSPVVPAIQHVNWYVNCWYVNCTHILTCVKFNVFCRRIRRCKRTCLRPSRTTLTVTSTWCCPFNRLF